MGCVVVLRCVLEPKNIWGMGFKYMLVLTERVSIWELGVSLRVREGWRDV